MVRSWYVPVVLVGSSLSLSGISAHAEGLWLRVGPVYRGGMDAEASGSSHVQSQGIHAASPRRSFPDRLTGGRVAGPLRDNISSYGNRTFDDGYVNMDAGTGNPSSIDPDVTWYWGYEDSSQYNSAADTLTFHRTTRQPGMEVATGKGRVVSLSTLRDEEASFDDTFGGWGLELSGGYPLQTRGRLGVELCGGMAGIWNAGAQMGGSTFEEQVREDRYAVIDTTDYITDTYVYDTSGVTLPPAPHRGTYDGPFDTPPVIPSPTIPNRPDSLHRDSVRAGAINRDIRRTSSSTWTARNQVDMDVETDIYELWVGPRLAFHANDWLALHLTPKVSLNYIDADVDRSESFVASYADGRRETLHRWTDQGDEQKWSFGAGLTAGADVEFKNGMFAGCWGGYEWVGGDVDVRIGPNTVSVDASGYSAGVVMGRRFGGGGRASEPAGKGLETELTFVDPPLPAPLAAPKEEAAVEPVVAAAPVADESPSQTLPSAPVSVPDEVDGEKGYQHLRALLVSGADVASVRAEIQALKQNDPEQFAAVLSHMRQRKAERAQMVMR
jgi:hypothetical protein